MGGREGGRKGGSRTEGGREGAGLREGGSRTEGETEREQDGEGVVGRGSHRRLKPSYLEAFGLQVRCPSSLTIGAPTPLWNLCYMAAKTAINLQVHSHFRRARFAHSRTPHFHTLTRHYLTTTLPLVVSSLRSFETDRTITSLTLAIKGQSTQKTTEGKGPGQRKQNLQLTFM